MSVHGAPLNEPGEVLFDDEGADLAGGRDGKADRAVVCLDLDDQRSKHVDPEDWRLCRYSG